MRNLAQAGHIATGTVDQRSIRDLRPSDVEGATQFHAFAGLGAWSYALRLAGWPDDRPVWTGSCPCQPFSSAGRKGGFDDERHLWPAWFDLIRECRPAIVFGEQVASPDGLTWLDLVSSDLEGAGYAFGASDLCAACVGAPHIRQRLYFVAYSDGTRLERRSVQPRNQQGERAARGSSPNGPWIDAEPLPCRDGKTRPVEPGTFPLAHGATARVGRLRAYGNAIVPEVAATFIRAVMEAVQ